LFSFCFILQFVQAPLPQFFGDPFGDKMGVLTVV